MDENNRNFILAIVLSMAVLFAWQYFFLPAPKPPETVEQQQQPTEPGPPRPGGETPGTAGAPQPGVPGAATLTRDEALAASPRIAIDTPALKGSISLKGGRIDDLMLKDYRETVEPIARTSFCFRPRAARRLLCRARFRRRRRRLGPRPAGRRHAVDRDHARAAHARCAHHADLRRGQGTDLQPHRRGRRQIYVHDHRQGRRTRAPSP